MEQGRQKRTLTISPWLWLAASLALLLGGGQLATPAHAHALLIRSIPEADAELPQSPPKLELWFSEPLEEGFNKVRLLASNGQEISVGPLVLDPADPTHLTVGLAPLGPGIYTVAWQNLSRVDGHEWVGSFPFSVLNPDGSRPTGAAVVTEAGTRGELPTPGEILARWLGFLGGILLLGAPVFRVVITPKSEAAEDAGLQTEASNLALRAVWAAALAVVVSAWLQLILQAARLGGLERLPDLLLATQTGALALARHILVLTGLVMMFSLPQPRPLRDQEWRFFIQLIAGTVVIISLFLLALTQAGWGWVAATISLAGSGLALAIAAGRREAGVFARRLWQFLLILALALLLTFSVGSHAGAAPGSMWAVLVDYLHLTAAAVWMGGLLLLPILIWQIDRSETERGQLLQLVRRFSYLAGLSVFGIAVTGLFSSLVQLPTWASLLETPYGRALLLKLLLVALALLAALLNNYRLHRRSEALQQAEGWRRFLRPVALEALLSLAILASVAVLTQTTAPRSSLNLEADVFEPGRPYNEVVKADDLNIHLQVTPRQVGRNSFTVHLYHEDPSSIGEVQLVRLFFNYQEAELGRASADLESTSQNIFNTSGAYINQSGGWDLSVYVRRRGLDDSLADFSLDVPPPSRSTVSADPWQNPIPTLPTGAVIGGGLMVIGVIPLIWGRPIKKAWPRLFLVATLSGGLLLLAGLAVITGTIF